MTYSKFLKVSCLFFLSDRNHCETNPCKNGAECYDTLRDYICICAEGYFGPDCEKSKPK